MIYVEDYLQEQGIDYQSSGKNVAATDVNVDCPWCGAQKHLGIMRETGIILCWVCNLEGVRYRTFISYIMKSEDCSFREAKDLLSSFSDEEIPDYGEYKSTDKKPSKLNLPKHTYNFFDKRYYSRQTEKAFSYLYKRRFDFDTIDYYKLKYCKAGRYKFRIIVPIYMRGQLVNFLGRDYTDKQHRYDNCRREEAIIQTSHLLYNWDNFVRRNNKHARIVEGVFDCFRIGNTSLGLIKSTLSQQQKSLLKALRLESCTLFLDYGAYSKAYSIGEELEPFIPAIKIIKMPDERDVADHEPEFLMKLEETTRFNVF